jgi:hypothetical protein
VTPLENTILNTLSATADLLASALPGCSDGFLGDCQHWFIEARFLQHCVGGEAREAAAGILDEFHRKLSTERARR